MSKIEDREAEVVYLLGLFVGCFLLFFFFPILYAVPEEKRKEAKSNQPTDEQTNIPEPHVMVVVKNCLKGICLKSQQSKDMSKLFCFSYKTYMQEHYIPRRYEG